MRHFPRAAATTVAALLSLTACGADAPAASPPPTSSPSATSAAPAEPRDWQSEVDPYSHSTPPVLVEGTVVVLTASDVMQSGSVPEHLLLAGVDPASGEQLWEVELPMPEGATLNLNESVPVLLAGDGAAVVDYAVDVPASGLNAGGDTRLVVAVDVASQDIVWEKDELGGLVPATGPQQLAMLYDDTIGTTAVDIASGEQRWQYSDGGVAFAVTGDAVVLTRRSAVDTSLIGLNAATGAVSWTTQGDGNSYFPAATRAGLLLAVYRTANINGATVTAVLLDAATGEVRAQAPAAGGGSADSGQLSPDGSAGYLFWGGTAVQALNGAGGWTAELPEDPNLSAPIPSSSQSLRSVTDTEVTISVNGLVTLDAATGEQVGEVQTPDGTGQVQELFSVDGVTVGLLSGTLVGTVE